MKWPDYLVIVGGVGVLVVTAFAPSRPARRWITLACMFLALILAGAIASVATAHPATSTAGQARAAAAIRAEWGTGPAGRKAVRVARCESNLTPTATSPGGTYRGLFQFGYPAWREVGGKGDPARATAREQARRALRLYRRYGWRPWPVCGRR